MSFDSLVDRLLNSPNPSVRWKVLVNVLGMRRDSAEVAALEQEILRSPLVEALLQRWRAGRGDLRGVYDKWQGSHWVMLSLADIGYPKGSAEILPLAEALFDTWLRPRFFAEREVFRAEDAYKDKDSIPVMQGRHRTCASQQGNALYSLMRLGVKDPRLDSLAERLMYWQWPDGGWNCDKNPDATTSTVVHTLWSMRALGLYARHTGNTEAHQATQRAAEFFLSRHLVKSKRTGAVLREEFLKLHYPRYWHYDVLGALKCFAEIGITSDSRFEEPLALLFQKQLKTGGWRAESKYFKASADYALGNDYVDWGGSSSKSLNEWVAADALYVARCFGMESEVQ